jgi:hypothetical protein
MPQIRAYLWLGVTLGMENMIDLGAGARYGWPKNILHWKGIQESLLDLCATMPVNFVIADGIVAMEGNGPLNGSARPLGKIVLADDPVAADAACSRLMGFEPNRIVHIREREIPRQRLSCTHRPGWRNRHRSGDSFPGGFGVSISSCILITERYRRVSALGARQERLTDWLTHPVGAWQMERFIPEEELFVMLISVPTASDDGIENVISWSMARGVPGDPTLSPESKVFSFEQT